MSENNKRYVYFISYMAFDKLGKSYFPGSEEVSMDQEVKSISDIRDIEGYLGDVHILNFQLLRTEDI